MLRLLLDHHISPDVSSAARRHAPAIDIRHLTDLGWEGLPDPELLVRACQQGLTLVTYDLTTIPQFLREFAERQQPHAGVIFIDDRTVAASNRGKIGRALARLWERERDADWQDRTCWLTRGG